MRKTRTLLLASVAALALAACDDSITGKSDFVRDEAQCASTDNPSACRQALMDARVQHARTAPAFATRESCEAAFGAANCEAAPGTPTPAQIAAAQTHEATQGQAQPQQVQQAGGGGFFMPLLMGYMMGRMAGGAMAAQPLYRDTNNRAYSGAGARPMGRFDDRVMPPPRTPAQTANAMPRGPQQTATSPTQARRGGFGSSGMGRMGGG